MFSGAAGIVLSSPHRIVPYAEHIAWEPAIVPYKNKTYVAFDGDNDIHYYRLMCAWKQNDNTSFSFFDAHDLNYARDTSLEESIKRQLVERFDNSKTFVLLIGEKTRYLRKFVPWEISQALRRDLPIICVNINGKRSQDESSCPSRLRDELAIHISFGARILQHALENWPARHRELKPATGPYYYKDVVYRRLGV